MKISQENIDRNHLIELEEDCAIKTKALQDIIKHITLMSGTFAIHSTVYHIAQSALEKSSVKRDVQDL